MVQASKQDLFLFFENSNNKFLALNEEEAKENGSTKKLLIDNDKI